jgi:uncharacterized membrane protein YfcA
MAWCQLRGWSKDATRAVFHPASLATMVVSAVSFGAAGLITRETVNLFVLGLPALLAGLWVGFKLYGRLNEPAFRKVVFALLIASGLALAVPEWILR